MGKLRRILGFLSFLAIVFFGTNSFAGSSEACQAGLYYESDTQTLETCPMGYYCPEGIGEYEEGQSTDACKIPCPGSFTDGGTGLSSEDQCVFTLKPGDSIDSCSFESVNIFDSCETYGNFACPGYSITYGAANAKTVDQWCVNDLSGIIKCPENSTTHGSYCTCNTGYFGWSGGVSGDKLDKLTSSTHTCMEASYYCEQGTYLPAGQTTCATCPAGYYCTGGTFDKTNVDQGITECPGDFTDGGSGLSSEDQCVFTLKPGTQLDSCDYFTVNVFETCDTTGNYFCPGYSVTVGEVDPANNVVWCSDYGRYKCPENSTSKISYCACNTGYFGWSGGAGGNKIDRLTSPTHICMEESYYCEQGTYLPAGQTTCATCPAGSYCIGDTYGYDASNDSGIEACPEGHTSSGGAGSEDECYPETYFVPFFCDSSKTTTIETQDVVYGGNIFGQPASVAQAKCDKPGYHVINYVCNNLEVMPGSTATYVSPFKEECVAEWGENNYFITIDYNTPVGCTDDDLCGSFLGKIAPALTAGDAQYKATKDISVQYNGTLAAVPIEYQQRKGYELVYYVPYPEDVTIFLDPNNESGATSMLWMVEDGNTGEYVSTTKWTYDGENNTSIKYYPMWRAKTITCDNGGYLPAGSETCEICPAGSYCDGGTFEYSDTTDQGKYPCPAFPYNNSGEGNGSQEQCYAYCKDVANYYSGGIVYYRKKGSEEGECAKAIYDVTFKCNGTTVSTSSVQYGGYITMPPADACNITGYYVSEWYEAGSNVTSGAPGSSINWSWTEVSNIVFNATLVPNTLTITYDAGDGSGNAPVAPTECTYADKDGACFAPASTFTPPTGQVFSQWLVINDGAADGGYLGTTFDPGADMAYMASNQSLSITLQAVYKISEETISCPQGSYLPAMGLTSDDCRTCEPNGYYCPGGAWLYATADQGIVNCPYIFIDGGAGAGTAKECVVEAIEGRYIVYDKSNTDKPFRKVKGTNTTMYYPTGSLTYGEALSDIEKSSLSTVRWFYESCPANSTNTDFAPYCTCVSGYKSSSTDAMRASLNAVIKSETCVSNTITCSTGTYYDGTSKTCETCPVGSYCDETVTVNKNSTTNAGLKSCITNAFTDGTVDNVTSDKGSTSKTDCQIRIPAGKQLVSTTGQIYDLESGWYSGIDSIINYSDELPAVDAYAASCAGDMGEFYNKSNPGATSHLECYGTITLNKSGATGLLYDADGTVVNGDETNTDSVDYKCYVSESDPYNNCVLPSTGTLSNPGWIINGWGTDSSCTVGASTINTSGMTPQSAEVFACMKQNIVKAQCDPGYFLPAYSDSAEDCENCRNSAYCVGGEYELNSTVDQGIEGCPEDYDLSEPGAENIGKCYTIQTEACTDPCGGERYCKNCPNDSFLSCAYDTTATVKVKEFYSGETEVVGDETCPVSYNTYTKCSSGMYLTNSAKDCSAKCSALTGSCKNATGGTETCWSSSINANMSAGANACYGAGCTPTCNLFNDYVLGTDGKLTGEYVNHCPEHATCIEATLPSNGYRWYPNTICTPTTFCSFTYTCDAGYVASTTGNIEYGYSRTLHGNPMTATTIASCDPGVFKVTLDANGGTGGTTTMYQKYTVGWYSDESASNALRTITIPKRDRYTFTGYYINNIEVVDMDGIVKPGASNLFTSDGVITAQWAAKSITCGAGYYYDYANMVCAECQSPYYCPGGTFDMTVDSGTSDLGKKDCKIDAFPYYAIANADKVFSDAKAGDITKCYIKIPAGKQINANWGLEDLQSGWANDGSANYYYTGSIPGIRDYAIKCSEDRNPFINESPVGATSTYQCYGTITLNKNEGTGSLNGEDANSRTATVTCSFETLDVYGKCELPMTGITKKGAKLAGWSVNNKCMDNVSWEYVNGLIEKQLPLQLSACWESESITCEPGYYFDYDNQKCAECMSPYYCPGGTFDMDDVNADGRVDCRIDAFPYYAGNIDASAIGSYRGAKAKTGCYVMLPAGKEIVSVDGRIADLRSGYYFGGGQVQYTGDIPDFTEYATKCSDDLGMSFYEHSNVGAESYTECYGTITLNKSGATGLLYDQSNNVINGDSETAQSVEYKCYATGDDVSFCSLPKTTSLSREGWSIGGWDTTYGCTGTGQTQINLNNMTSGTDMYVCMSRSRITCDAGMYLPMGATTCRECEMGKYCPGGTFTYSESADNGLNQCPSIFTYGDTGTKSESECRTMAIEAQYIKYANGVFQIAQDDSDNEYCTGGMLTYGQAMTDVAKGENTWFKYQCPSNSSNTDGAPYCLCNENYTTTSDDATLIALNAAISGNMCLRNTCEAGTYMKNNECVVCPAGNVCSTDVPGNAPKTCSELTGGLYTLSAPGSSSIDACYTECEEYAITNGTAVPVEDTVFYPFECEFTGRSQTGNPCDIVNGTCIETSCNHNFELINGICTPCARENAISYKQGGNCVIESCVSGFHPNGQVCEANVIECSAPNAIASTQKWDSNKNAFGECIITECADGYHLGSNACQANEQVCELEHGIGVREWNHNTNKWGECVATECDPGYTNDSSLTNEGWKQCGRCNNMYSANGELAVSSYVKGCEIASCMYQGELYNLENNECRLICDTYSDETGSRKWNASRKKCEHTCAPGYVTW